MKTIEEEIAAWAATRPAWQQLVLHELAGGHPFDQSKIDAIAMQLRTGTQSKATPLKATEIPGSHSAGGTVALKSIRDITNVNALLGSQELTLGETGLTVVYGDNASGKSGYARLIKDAVGARHEEPVHTNVFADTAGQSQKAEIEFTSAGADMTATWPGSVSNELRSISFYDEACGDAYVGGDSELTYRPSALVMLDGLIAVCDAVRSVLDDDLRQNQALRGPLPTVPEGTPASAFLSGLSGTTTTAQLDAACALPAGVDEQLGKLLQEEARLRATDPSKERTRLGALAGKVEGLARHIASLAAGLSDEKVSEAVAARRDALGLRSAATVASSGTFEGEPVPGVGSETWRALWEAARRFSEVDAYHDRHFPVTGDNTYCVLCQQALSIGASDRLERFHAFMQDATAQRATAAEQSLERLVNAIRVLEPTPSHIAAHLVELEVADASLAKTVSDWLQSVATRRASLLVSLDGVPDTEVSLLPSSPQSVLNARTAELQRAAASIDATQFEEALSEIAAKKGDLEGRIALSRQRVDVEAEIKRLAERAKIEEAKGVTDTSGITRKASDLTDAHVTSLVRDWFIRESDRLRLERIELRRTGGQKGKLRHRPALLGATAPQPVQQVLSEGEQTALGLAGYFTEAHFDDSKSALVLDDPVTSLDHIRRTHVARRLAQLATDRQVVVFTHDVAFVGDLHRAGDEEQVRFTERGVQRLGGKTPGLLTDQHPWRVKDVPRRFDELSQQLARIKRERTKWDEDTYDKECADWAGKLSETWERLINLEVIYPVVDPGTSEVRPRMFKLLARITDQDDREFQQSYGRVSGWARRHDKSPSTNYVAPDPSELEQELTFVRTWFDRVKKYRQ